MYISGILRSHLDLIGFKIKAKYYKKTSEKLVAIGLLQVLFQLSYSLKSVIHCGNKLLLILVLTLFFFSFHIRLILYIIVYFDVYNFVKTIL